MNNIGIQNDLWDLEMKEKRFMGEFGVELILEKHKRLKLLDSGKVFWVEETGEQWEKVRKQRLVQKWGS